MDSLEFNTGTDLKKNISRVCQGHK